MSIKPIQLIYHDVIEQLGVLTDQQRLFLLSIITLTSLLLTVQLWLWPEWQSYRAVRERLLKLQVRPSTQDVPENSMNSHPSPAVPANWPIELAENLLQHYHARALMVMQLKPNQQSEVNTETGRCRLQIKATMRFVDLLAWLNTIERAKVNALSIRRRCDEAQASPQAPWLNITMEVLSQ